MIIKFENNNRTKTTLSKFRHDHGLKARKDGHKVQMYTDPKKGKGFCCERRRAIKKNRLMRVHKIASSLLVVYQNIQR